MFDAIVFDLDGTLLDTIQDLANAANYVCRQNGWPQYTVDQYKYFVGNGIPKLVERFSPAEARTPDRLAHTLDQFSRRYAAHKADVTAPYPGIPEALEQLRQAGVVLGVLSNKEDTLARAIVEQYFGSGIFAHVQGALPGLPVKPDPTTLRALLARPEFAGRRVLFVGDSDVDILTARNAGLPGCGVLWGFRTRQELESAGAAYIIQQPHQLVELAAI